MADTLTPVTTPSLKGSAQRAPRPPRPVMSPRQLQAYFLARGTLRRLRRSPPAAKT